MDYMDNPKVDYAAEVLWLGLRNWANQVPFRIIIVEKLT